ncbi:hypothetical protein O0L34_g12405 [Tuta absoluta]|nr:hypothetical protein O0L34_g12405 [Tuta absoluta]
MMWWAIWCAAVVAAGAGAAAAPAPDSLGSLPVLDLEQIDASAPDDESVDYALSPGGRYSRSDDSGAGWLYYYPGPQATRRLSEMHEGRARSKRKMPSLSINNPMEVLRQRLMMEVARKQMREASQRQAVANRVFLQNVGKRGFLMSRASERYGN